MKNVMLGGFHGNPNIGLYGFATDEYCLLGKEVPAHTAEQIGKTLHVPVHQISIAGTGLIGVFITGNKHGIIVPEIAFENELTVLRKHKIPFTVIDSDFTALGNNVLATDTFGIANPEYSAKSVQAIEKALRIKLTPYQIAGMPTVGVMVAANHDGALVHSEATSHDIKFLSNFIKGEIVTGSVNFGNSFVRSGIIANNKGLVIGSKSTGVEVSDAEQAFGVIRV